MWVSRHAFAAVVPLLLTLLWALAIVHQRWLLAPFNPKIVKEVTASLVAPFLINGLKIAIGRLSGSS